MGLSWEAPGPGRHRQRGRLARWRAWREGCRREAGNREAIRSGRGLVDMGVPPPVPSPHLMTPARWPPADYDG